MPQKDIAERLGVKPPRVSQLVKEARDAGLIDDDDDVATEAGGV